MAAALVIALHRALYATRPSVLRWVPLMILSVAMPMSVSRSAILAAAVAGLIMFCSWPNRWRVHGLVIVPIALVGLRLLVPGLVGTIRSLFTNLGNDPSVTGRTDDYRLVFGIIADQPLLGRGLFTFVPQYYRILDNQLLMLLIELGALGGTAALLLLITGYCSARGARLRAPDARSRHLAVTISGAIAGVVLSYATFDAWGFPMVAGLTFLLLGLAGAMWQISRSETPAEDLTIDAIHDGLRRLRP